MSKKDKQFVILITGSGEGCDYTIGCNKTWKFIDAPSIEEAMNKFLGKNPKDEDEEEFHEDYFYNLDFQWNRYNSDDEFSLDSIEIFEISESKDVGTVCLEYQKAYNQRIDKIVKATKDKKERAEYERLKAKFG